MAKASGWEIGWGLQIPSRTPEEKVRGSARNLGYKRPGSQAKESSKARIKTWARQVRMAPRPLEAGVMVSPSYPKQNWAEGSAECEPLAGEGGQPPEHRAGETGRQAIPDPMPGRMAMPKVFQLACHAARSRP